MYWKRKKMSIIIGRKKKKYQLNQGIGDVSTKLYLENETRLYFCVFLTEVTKENKQKCVFNGCLWSKLNLTWNKHLFELSASKSNVSLCRAMVRYFSKK